MHCHLVEIERRGGPFYQDSRKYEAAFSCEFSFVKAMWCLKQDGIRSIMQVMGGIKVLGSKQKCDSSLGHSQSLKIYPFISFGCLALGMFSVPSFQLFGSNQVEIAN